MKKIFLSLLFVCCMYIPSLAYVEPGNQHDMNLMLSYPLVYTVDKDAQEKINTDIASYVESAKSDYYTNHWYKVRLTYAVKYEDDHIISIVLTRLRDGGGAHPQEHFWGLVYNKDTGDRVPLSDFATIGSADQWSHLDGTQIFPAYNWQWNRIALSYRPKFISEDYYLTGHGIFYMIYQPYEVSYGENSMISIQFNPSNIDYLKRLNG